MMLNLFLVNIEITYEFRGMLEVVKKYRDLLILVLLCSCLSHTANAKLNDIELCSEVFAYNGEAYFCGDHAQLGREIFRSDGTSSGTSVVKDIDIGLGSSSPQAFFEYRGFMFFFAETTLTGMALWRSDGTSAGTKLIKMLGLSSSVYLGKVVRALDIGDELLVQTHNHLLRTDGTHSGTSLVEALITSSFSSSLSYWPATTFIYQNGLLYFITWNRLFKMELSDDMPTLIREIPSVSGYYPAAIIEGGFSQSSIQFTNSNSIWRSDGTRSGTEEILSNIYVVAPLNTGVLYCDLNDGSLYVRQAGSSTSTLIFEDIHSKCQVLNFGNVGGSMLLRVGYGDENAIWVTNGTVGSTKKVTDSVSPGYGGYGIYKSPKGYLFSGDSGVTGRSELWRTDGSSSGTRKVKNFNLGTITNFTAASSGVFFTFNSRAGYQLWHSDGTSNGTILVKNIPRYIDDWSRWTEGHRIYFTVDHKLWHSDGTPGGTYKLRYWTPDEPVSIVNPATLIFPILMFLLDECMPVTTDVCN